MTNAEGGVEAAEQATEPGPDFAAKAVNSKDLFAALQALSSNHSDDRAASPQPSLPVQRGASPVPLGSIQSSRAPSFQKLPSSGSQSSMSFAAVFAGASLSSSGSKPMGSQENLSGAGAAYLEAGSPMVKKASIKTTPPSLRRPIAPEVFEPLTPEVFNMKYGDLPESVEMTPREVELENELNAFEREWSKSAVCRHIDN